MLRAADAALRLSPGAPDLLFARTRALFLIGQLKGAEASANALWASHSAEPVLQGLPECVARSLLSASYYEQARPWLRIALSIRPSKELKALWERIRLPAYLKPEEFDRSSGETVLRYAPRESSNYVYAIDVVGTCNLACPSCPVANSDDQARAKGTMSVELFTEILTKISAECPDKTPEIWLYNWGEPLLHPQLATLIGLVRDLGLRCMLSSNLNYDRGLLQLEQALPDVIKISLSGFAPGTYERSHTGGDIERVKRNMRRLAEIQSSSTQACEVWVGHHLYRHNFHERDEVRRFCEELGFRWQPVQAFWQPSEKLVELKESNTLSDSLLQELLVNPIDNARHVREYRQKAYDCELRFNQTTINVDGSVSLCCSTYSMENRLPQAFLDASHAEISAAKYRHDFCSTCRKHGFDYSISRLPETVRAE
ncbi:MAG: hypothetical protein Cons2KO_10580 [Congregibacter sp.]